MKFKLAAASLFALLLCESANPQQNPISDQLDQLKQNLSPEQQQALQGAIGGTGAGGAIKTDPRLSMPNTVFPPNGQMGLYPQVKKPRKTADDRILREFNEDPELRADDTVLIDLTPIEDLDCYLLRRPINPNNPNANNPDNANLGNPGDNGLNTSGVDLNALQNGAGIPGGPTTGTTGTANQKLNQPFQENRKCLAARPKPDAKPKTDEEKDRSEKFRTRILAKNPYRLNRFGVLEIPGLPSIPVAGLTASEATDRLNADPDLIDYDVKLTLLRLEPFGEEALKPFGYDLFEGVPTTFAPVSDIQVPLDYVVGPGDRLDVQLYGSELVDL